MKRLLISGLTIVLLLVPPSATSWARGFGGGFRGGGAGALAGGGGFRGAGGLGGVGAGGFSRGAGGLGAGGLGAGGLGAGDFGRGGLSAGGLGGGELGRGGLSGGGLGGGELGRDGLGEGGLGAGGLGGERLGGGGLSDLRQAGGLPGGLGDRFSGAAPSRGQLSSFLGLPSDSGLHHLSAPPGDFDAVRGAAAGPRGVEAAGGAVVGPRGGEAAGGAVRGPRGNVVAAGGAVGPRGNAAGFAAVSTRGRYVSATAVRGSFHHYDLYGRGWYTDHPGAWFAAGWAAGSAWTAATWNSLGAWFDYGAAAPVYYNYGGNVVYQDDSVYVNGQDVGTAQQYYQQAQTLAGTSASGDDTSASGGDTSGDWLPLGVFAMTQSGQDSSNMVIQLAVNKAGILRGNYTDTASNSTQPVRGSVDKATQRAAWTIGDNQNTVIETGLYNLTKDEAPALVHFGADRTEQWLLVRLKKNDQSGAGQDPFDAGQDQTGAGQEPSGAGQATGP